MNNLIRFALRKPISIIVLVAGLFFFGINAVRKPDAFATIALKLSAYRKLDPGRWEEAIFFDHPSGRTRIHTAMVWKKEHIGDLDIRDTANLP